MTTQDPSESGETRRAAIAQRIRAAREMAGLSQGQLAKLLNLHRPSISEAEAGRRRIPAEELAKIADLCAVSVSWLAGQNGVFGEPGKEKLSLAARELARLRDQDFNRVIELVRALQRRNS